METLTAHDKAILNCVFNPNLPLEEVINHPVEELKDDEDSTPEVETTKQMEVEAVIIAEKGDLEHGLKLIDDAIAKTPQRPSLYNNRAYILQFLRKFEEAFDDTTRAISFCTPGHKKTLCLAYCQRGVLHKRAGRLELARDDFDFAAKMGNQFAKAQLVELNPYAALCNQMLRQVMDTLK